MAVPCRVVPWCVLVLVAGCGKSTAAWTHDLKSADPAARLHAVHALQQRPGERETVIPALVDTLKDPDTYVRRDAARALGQFGPDARPAVRPLVALLKDREPGVRQAAGQSLEKIDPAAARKAGARPK